MPLVVSELSSVVVVPSNSSTTDWVVVDIIGTIASVVPGKIVEVSPCSVGDFSVVDKLGSKVEITSVIKSKIPGVVVSTGFSVAIVVVVSIPRGSGYMNSPR